MEGRHKPYDVLRWPDGIGRYGIEPKHHNHTCNKSFGGSRGISLSFHLVMLQFGRGALSYRDAFFCYTSYYYAFQHRVPSFFYIVVIF